MNENSSMGVGARRSGRRVAAVLAAAAVVLAACGSGGGGSASSVKAPAGAKENATAYAGSAVCYDLYVANKATPCAENTIGPGGGLIFYDAGRDEPWGRFLEVAPWSWNPELPPFEGYACDGGCGAADSLLRPTKDRTQDAGKSYSTKATPTNELGLTYRVCSTTYDASIGQNNGPSFPDSSGTYPVDLGAGRSNTSKLLAASPGCGSLDTGTAGALALVQGYRGGGRDDWFLPSKDELNKLYIFGNRDAIGGFAASGNYVSSSMDWSNANTCGQSTQSWCISYQVLGTGTQGMNKLGELTGWNQWATGYLVRPIRAFS